jgi:hypothetical protein
MDPLTIMALAQGGMAIYQGIQGLTAAKKNKAPQYTIPSEYKQNLAAAQMTAAGGLPNASKQLAQQQMGRSTASGLAQFQDRNMVATGVAGLAQAQADQANRLAAMDADARLKGDLQVANARATIAGAKDKEFAIKQQNYLQRAKANAEMISAATQNLFGAGESYASNDMMKQYYGLGDYSTGVTKNVMTTPTADKTSPYNFFGNFRLMNNNGYTRY